jgi:ABC-2 type transport system permease protein
MRDVSFHPWRPFYTLLKREVLRFLSVAVQTLITPVITASLYLLVFGVSLGSQISLYPNVPYVQFVVPGLILMGALNNAFANSSSSIFMYTYLGNIVDILVTPITAGQFLWAFILSSVLRAILVGGATWLVSLFFTGLPWVNPLAAVGILLLASLLFALFGILAAIYSKTFDGLSMFTNFLILPLIYTGGLFYPVSQLPPFWRAASHFNPLTYMIDGFRQAVIGIGDTSLALDFGITGGLALALFVWCWWVIASGDRLRP